MFKNKNRCPDQEEREFAPTLPLCSIEDLGARNNISRMFGKVHLAMIYIKCVDLTGSKITKVAF